MILILDLDLEPRFDDCEKMESLRSVPSMACSISKFSTGHDDNPFSSYSLIKNVQVIRIVWLIY